MRPYHRDSARPPRAVWNEGRSGLGYRPILSSSSTSSDTDPSEDSIQESVGESPYPVENQWSCRNPNTPILEWSEVRHFGWLSDDDLAASTIRLVTPPTHVPENIEWRNAPFRIRDHRETSLESTSNSIRELDLNAEELVNKLNRDYPATAAALRRKTSSPSSYLKIVMMMKNLGTTRFNGGIDPFEADAWLKNLERNFNATRCPDDFKKDVAVFYLERDAFHWWFNQERSYEEGVVAWNNFRREFKRKYIPPETRNCLEQSIVLTAERVVAPSCPYTHPSGRPEQTPPAPQSPKRQT